MGKSTSQHLQRTLFIASTLALAMATTGCASRMVDVRAGSEQVSLATPDQVVNCAPRGNVTVSVLTSVGFVSRSAEAVEANLLQLARNSAVNEGADTLVRKESSKFGERTFGLYKCRP